VARVAGYRTWQEGFDRHVKEGELAVWIWAPLITKQCPECEKSPSYHEDSDRVYDETPPEEWFEDLVGFNVRRGVYARCIQQHSRDVSYFCQKLRDRYRGYSQHKIALFFLSESWTDQ